MQRLVLKAVGGRSPLRILEQLLSREQQWSLENQI